MTATTSRAVAEWVKLFPRHVTETYTSSVTFMKQLTTLAVSTITYLKKLFPNENYNIEKFGGLNITVMKTTCVDEVAQFLSTALVQSFDAFNKKYLHQLALCFYDGECQAENLLEYHVFEYTYRAEGAALALRSKGAGGSERVSSYTNRAVQDQTMHMLRTCVLITQSFPELPSMYNISLRLYYNENTPEGYQAPGFVCPDAADHLAPTLGSALRVGLVQTPFHHVQALSYSRGLAARATHEANNLQNIPIAPNENEDLCEPDSELASEKPRVRCDCNRTYEEDDSLVLLTCKYCNTAQHAECYGFRCGRSVTSHCCNSCAAAAPARTATCQKLASLPNHKERENCCLYRRTLAWCARGEACAATLVRRLEVSRSQSAWLMKWLQAHGVLDQKNEQDLITPQKVNMESLKTAMSKYFQDEESSVVERLMAEETLSQTNRADPVGAALGPVRTGRLRSEAPPELLRHTPSANVAEDSTLKQYREAISSSGQQAEGELPLSGTHNPVQDMNTIGKKVVKRKIESARPRCGAKFKIAK